jgi:hypothetical protein
LIEVVDAEFGMSLLAFVFFIITWESPEIDPTVVARWMEILLAIVPHRDVSTEKFPSCSSYGSGRTITARSTYQAFQRQSQVV